MRAGVRDCDPGLLNLRVSPAPATAGFGFRAFALLFVSGRGELGDVVGSGVPAPVLPCLALPPAVLCRM